MDCLDASVVVKWFKEGENFRNEALEILSAAIEGETTCTASEWLTLEVIRALNKAGSSKKDINKTCNTLTEFYECKAIHKIPVTPVIEKAQNLMIELNLQAADAIHLATAIQTKSTTFWTEDEHFHKKTIRDYAKKHKLEIKKLRDM